MKFKASTKLPPLDIDKEVKELKILLKEIESKLAPGDEITPDKPKLIRKSRKTNPKPKQP